MTPEPRITMTAEEAAAMLECTPEKVQELARDGRLPGVQFGRSWVFPLAALSDALNEIAREEAAKRREKPAPAAVVKRPESRKPPKLDLLCDKPRREVLTPQ